MEVVVGEWESLVLPWLSVSFGVEPRLHATSPLTCRSQPHLPTRELAIYPHPSPSPPSSSPFLSITASMPVRETVNVAARAITHDHHTDHHTLTSNTIFSPPASWPKLM